MKKSILITMPSMFIGGAERSLLGLLNAIDYEQFDVDLFLYRQEGEFFRFIPDRVNLLPVLPEYGALDLPIKRLLLSKQFPFGFARILAKFFIWLNRRKGDPFWRLLQAIYFFLEPLLPQISEKEYDLAIGFLGIHNLLLSKTRARVKAGWIHTDYDTIDPNEKLDCKVYSQLDYIVNVSQSCTQAFIKRYPQFSDKSITIENILSPISVLNQAEIEDVWTQLHPEGDEITLLSVGRLTYAKNFENVPWICRQLVEQGFNLRWYLIGAGGLEGVIRRNIREAEMENRVILLGQKENPYPYMRACDLYVQPSRFEGKAVTVREAQILHKPVAITAFSTAKNQLDNGVDGVILPLDNSGCAQGIAQLLHNPEKMLALAEKTKIKCYGNEAEVEKIYHLMEGLPCRSNS